MRVRPEVATGLFRQHDPLVHPVRQIGRGVAGDVPEGGVRRRLAGLVLTEAVPGGADLDDAEAVQLQRATGGVRTPGSEGEGARRRVGPRRRHQHPGQDDEQGERPVRLAPRNLVR
jgi:hypothetical protein